MLKRSFDIVASTLGLFFLLPVIALITVAIRLTSPGPVIFKSTRIGVEGKPFTLFKFRSMVADAHKQGPGVTGSGDKRVTTVGRFLRRSKLDELPQLYNVLRGDMSLVGPRPEDPRYVALYTPEQRQVLQLRPGITSLASLTYRNEEFLLTGDDPETLYIREILPTKLIIELDYARNASLGRDISILFRTFISLFR